MTLYRKRLLALSLALLMVFGLFAGCNRGSDAPLPVYRTSTEGVFSYDNATVYFAMTDRFHDGNAENNNAYGRPRVDSLGKSIATFNGGDFKGFTEKIEAGYFDALGVDAIWISAAYEQVHGYLGGGREADFAHYGFHGYYALDWTMTDRSFGTVEEFRAMVDAAHARGIRIIMDVVMNHVGYPNLQDMLDYDYGGFAGLLDEVEPRAGENFDKWTRYVDWTDPDAWTGWWGDWVRAGLPGYHPPGEGVLDMNLAGLPDIRTEVEEDIGLPPILITKWAGEDAAYDPWIVPAARGLREDRGLAPYEYLIAWLSAWVEEFGIDGFRIDTAKHVEIERWAALKEAANDALWRFRAKNPENPAAAFTEDFYFIGEVWGHGVQRNYYYDNGFDALINFTFQGERRDGPAYHPDRMTRIFENYAAAINSDDSFNVLSYLSQHDTSLYPRHRLLEGGTFLLLLPGAVKIFYGDETGREAGDGGTDGTMGTRSYMNWDSVEEDVLEHFRRLGSFRRRNMAVGAGMHTTLSTEPFVFLREWTDGTLENTVLVYQGPSGAVTLDVSAAFEEGALVRDGYTMEVRTVKDGTIALQVHEQGLALLEEVFPVETP